MNTIINTAPISKINTVQPESSTAAQNQTSFANTLKSAIDNLNHAQIESDKMTEALAAGKTDDLHQVMITAQKASILLETTVQMQQKVIDAYNEVMRMQI